MSQVLSSWKEIAQYFGKGVRTVQRWEEQLGLPVRRAHRENKSAVLAIPEELDSWIHSVSATGAQTELMNLRNENRALRAENYALKLQLAQQSTPLLSTLDSCADRDVLARTFELIRQSIQLGEQTHQLRDVILKNTGNRAASVDIGEARKVA